MEWKLTKRFGIVHVCYYCAFIVVMLTVTFTDPPFLDSDLHSWYGTRCPNN
jgi:hypothetical protein